MTKKRLAALELAAEKAREARRAARQVQLNRAHARLTREEVQALQALLNATPEELAAVEEASRPYVVDMDIHGHFVRWAEFVDDQPDDQPLIPAPAGAIAHFEGWAAHCRGALTAPECVGSLRTAFWWHLGPGRSPRSGSRRGILAFRTEEFLGRGMSLRKMERLLQAQTRYDLLSVMHPNAARMLRRSTGGNRALWNAERSWRRAEVRRSRHGPS